MGTSVLEPLQPSQIQLRKIRSLQAEKDAMVTRRLASLISAGADHFSRDREICEGYLAATAILFDLTSKFERRAQRLKNEARQ